MQSNSTSLLIITYYNIIYLRYKPISLVITRQVKTGFFPERIASRMMFITIFYFYSI